MKVMGGVDATVSKAISFLEKGDLRFAAELASHAVFAAPDSETARQVLWTALTELGYGAECATWRNCFLVGATELFHPVQHTEVSGAGMAPALTVTQLFDSIAIRINGPKAWNEHLRINWTVGGESDGSDYRMELSNGALIHFPATVREEADLHVTATKAQLIALLLRGQTDGIEMSGDAGVLATLVGLVDSLEPRLHGGHPVGASPLGPAGHLVGPQLGGHRDGPAVGRGAVGAGVAVGEGGRGDPGLERRLVTPAGDHEPRRRHGGRGGSKPSKPSWSSTAPAAAKRRASSSPASAGTVMALILMTVMAPI